jgi:hypothetical protein
MKPPAAAMAFARRRRLRTYSTPYQATSTSLRWKQVKNFCEEYRLQPSLQIALVCKAVQIQIRRKQRPVGLPSKLVSFRISRNTKRNKFRVLRNKLVVSRNFAMKRNKQFRMFLYFLNETKQSVSHVS